MNPSDSILNCSANLEWKNNQGVVIRKVAHKSAGLRIIRSDSRDMFIELSADKSAKVKLLLKDINVHNKFMSEGKASIVFQEIKCTLYVSNAPPGSLLNFLKIIFVKMTGEKNKTDLNTSLRTQLLSNNPSSFDEISPVTVAELKNAHKLSTRVTDTTPSPSSRKRKLEATSLQNNRKDIPAAKKLYSTSPIPEQLNIEQQQIFDACLAGHNVFFTGSAGTGKSFLLKKIISALPPDVTIATASTGVAACHIGGATLHSFAGIGNGDATLNRAYQLASKPATATLWRKCKHLIIDEISMLDGMYFEKIEAVARHVRKNDKPFGGIQLILCGDFLQLPPVIRSDLVNDKNRIKFCFQSPVWDKCVQICYELKIVHRQSDREFINILNNLRIGRITPEITEILTKTAKQKIEQDGILATRLCSHTNEADTINKSKLDGIDAIEKVFNAEDSNVVYSNVLDQQTPVPKNLILKKGAQVMLLKNINMSAGLVNGARGVVIDFKSDLPVVRFRNNKVYTAKPEKWVVKTLNGGLIARRQVPLKLAWAFSIHKSQGLTLDCVEMSLARVFEAGQAYVALSRAQSLETLRVLDFDAKQVWANTDVLDFYRKLRRKIDLMEVVPVKRKKSNNDTKSVIKKLKSNLKANMGYLSSKPLVTIS